MARILVADDSAAYLNFITDALKETSHEIITASEGEEAEQKARTQVVDLIILDIIMPKKTGFQVCRGLKNDERLRKIPIILVSTKSQESDRVWGLRQGADEYLTKPFQPSELLLAVKKLLKRQ